GLDAHTQPLRYIPALELRADARERLPRKGRALFFMNPTQLRDARTQHRRDHPVEIETSPRSPPKNPLHLESTETFCPRRLPESRLTPHLSDRKRLGPLGLFPDLFVARLRIDRELREQRLTARPLERDLHVMFSVGDLTGEMR